MKKIIIILACILLAAGAFAESSFQISLTNSLAQCIAKPLGTVWVGYQIWPYSMDIISLTYLHDITEGSRFQLGGDIGGGTWGTFAAVDAAYSMPAFTAGNYNFDFTVVEKIGVYIPYFSLISVTDLDLTAQRPGKKFFIGAGLSTSVNALWGTNAVEEPYYNVVVRPDIKVTCGWRFD